MRIDGAGRAGRDRLDRLDRRDGRVRRVGAADRVGRAGTAGGAGRLADAADGWWFSGPGAWLRAAAEETARLLFPAQCAVCAAPGEALCADCLGTALRSTLRPRVVDDLAQLDVLAPRRRAVIVSSGPYGAQLAATLLEAKRQHGRPLLRRLGPALARALRCLAAEVATTCPARAGHERVGAAGTWVVPVPPSGASLRRRGFWPVDELLRASGVPAGWSRWDALVAIPPLLRPRPSGGRRVPWAGAVAQKAKGRRARWLAVRGSVRVADGADLRGGGVGLVDDVMTSGATLAECARVVRAAGGRVLGAAVVAHVHAPSNDCGEG